MKVDSWIDYRTSPSDIVPGTILLPRPDSIGGATAYNDQAMTIRAGFDLINRDGPFLVIANVAAEEQYVTYRPTLVLARSGRLVWVADFMLERLAHAFT